MSDNLFEKKTAYFDTKVINKMSKKLKLRTFGTKSMCGSPRGFVGNLKTCDRLQGKSYFWRKRFLRGQLRVHDMAKLKKQICSGETCGC